MSVLYENITYNISLWYQKMDNKHKLKQAHVKNAKTKHAVLAVINPEINIMLPNPLDRDMSLFATVLMWEKKQVLVLKCTMDIHKSLRLQ